MLGAFGLAVNGRLAEDISQVGDDLAPQRVPGWRSSPWLPLSLNLDRLMLAWCVVALAHPLTASWQWPGQFAVGVVRL